ncbi:MAG: CAP domain-containing protein [Rhodobacteraceae bacterium]|nr:CAP domain-containing protein [Paracoccaceae bacterium]
MDRRTMLMLGGAAAALAACSPTMGAGPKLGPDGQPLPQVYPTAAQGAGTIEFRMLDAVNALRQARGMGQVTLNAQLNAAAATHARDMSVQNRPWHFGSDGSSPLTRVQRVGYTGKLLGELISETYETELETLATWMESPDMRNVILDPAATDLGFAWFQEPNGKIWWTLVTGSSGGFGGFQSAAFTG